MSVTLEDVAKKAGVSHTTVSMVIHNDPRITVETKERVSRAIKELNYHPNYMARGLAKGKTNTIAVVSSFYSSFFELEILRGFHNAMNEIGEGYELNQYSTLAKAESKKNILRNILYGKRADAVIVLNLKPDKALLSEFKRNEVPLVLVEEQMKGVHVLKMNNEKGGFIATEYLLKKGRKNIAVIGGELSGEEIGISPRERLDGYKKALEAAGIAFRQELVAEIKDYSMEDGRMALRMLLEKNLNTDAVFCSAGDIVACGVIAEAKERGIKIPQDISLVGYDDIMISSLVSPALTTVKQPVEKMGEDAFRTAIEAAENKIKGAKVEIFEPELVIRETA